MESVKKIATVKAEIHLQSSDKSVKTNLGSSQKIVCKHVFTEDFWIATILFVAYLIETIVQIVLIVNCYRSLLYLSGTSSLNWLWILFIGWVVTSLLVTLLSIIWTFRGMDFSGRVCGQLLCYLMHFFLLGFLWRYLKISLAYEKADVEEFFSLRKLQIYIQAFPLLAIHLAYLINTSTQSYDNTMGWMIAGELCSSIISLSLHPLLKLKSESLDDQPSDHKHKPRLTSAAVEINVTIRILLLISRVIVVGLLVSLTSYWPMLVILAHLMTTFMWTCLTTYVFNGQTNPSSTTIITTKSDVESNEWNHTQVETNVGVVSSKRCYNPSSWVKNRPVGRHVKNSLVSCYALFWDVNVNLSTCGDGLDLWCLSLPVLLVLVENVAVLIFHLRQCQTTIFFVIVSGTCFFFGLLLFIIVTTWNKWDIFFHSQNLKQLPDTDAQINVKRPVNEMDGFAKVLQNPVILDHYNLNNCQDVQRNAISLVNELNQSRSDSHWVDGVISNLGTSEITNTCNYGRINESLMAVKMHEGGNLNMNNEHEESNLFRVNPGHDINIHPHKIEHRDPCLHKPYVNTMSSTSSRNTNTTLHSILRNSPQENLKTAECDQPTYPIYQSSPLVIRKASKVQLKLNPRKQSENWNKSHSHQKIEQASKRSRCRCHSKLNDKCDPRIGDNIIYEKLIEDAYGILICEGESGGHNSESLIKQDSAHSTSATAFSKKLRVLCAFCLQNHDPLLSNCCINQQPSSPEHQKNFLRLNNQGLASANQMHLCTKPFDSPKLYSETTEYPTDTEFTCNLNDNEDEMSNSTHYSTFHTVAYVNLPIQCQTSNSGNFNNIFTPSSMLTSADVRKEYTGLEYVRAWLLMNDVEARNMLNNRGNSRTHSLNRGNCNKVSSKSKHISKFRPNSTLTFASGNPYRKSQPVRVQWKPPPLQKQHPHLKNTSSSISHCQPPQSLGPKRNKYPISNVKCNEFHNSPGPFKDFIELQYDLLETVV